MPLPHPDHDGGAVWGRELACSVSLIRGGQARGNWESGEIQVIPSVSPVRNMDANQESNSLKPQSFFRLHHISGHLTEEVGQRIPEQRLF